MAEEKKIRRPDVGGQAVMEGVMMRSPEYTAISVRREDGSIITKRERTVNPAQKHKWMGWPVVRGAVSLFTMLTGGMKTITDSVDMLGIEEEEPSKFEKWLSKVFGTSIDKIVMAVAIIFAVAFSVGLFVLLPNLAVMPFNRIENITPGMQLLKNLVSALVRIAILIGYMYLCGKVPDVRRTFMYHGSEHKTVYCNEHELELTPENAQKFSTLHPRCGTSFILITFILSLIFYSVIDVLILITTGYPMDNYFIRVLSRLILLPLVAGLSYEVLKGLAHNDSKVCRVLRWPGLMMQKLTTKQPTDDMCQVAIISMKSALGEEIEGTKMSEGWICIPADSPLAQPLPEKVIEKRKAEAEKAAQAAETEETAGDTAEETSEEPAGEETVPGGEDKAE
ncbi:MAG: DUF1385 domain-containing protein [Clostridiales bacterium]|nr:DUF1385 domain-containing protein [Clostridiales bacterium]